MTILHLMKNDGSYWGKYQHSDYPKVYYDPFQSFIVDGIIYGYRVHVIPSRSNRPRENILPQSVELPVLTKEKSLLMRITRGEELCIPITGDRQILSDPNDNPELHDLSKYEAVSIINKYSPTSLKSGNAHGVSIIAYPNLLQQTLTSIEPVTAVLITLKTALRSILLENTNFTHLKAPLIFFNIGPSSGATLNQLHAQAYLLPRLSGQLSYAYMEAYKQSKNQLKSCLACLWSNKETLTDHLNQEINVKALTVYEDKYLRLVMSNAPIRPMSLRIIPKRHIVWFGGSNDAELESFAKALVTAHGLILKISKGGSIQRRDRTIAFRHGVSIDEDFHFIIDIMPSIPLGGAEVIDSLTMSTIEAEVLVAKMKEMLNQ